MGFPAPEKNGLKPLPQLPQLKQPGHGSLEPRLACSFGKTSVDCPVADVRNYRIVENIQKAQYRSMCAWDAGVVQRELGAQCQLEVIADVCESRSGQ
jgi:hypothetical protein